MNSADAPPIIEVERLTKYYGAFVGIYDVSFKIFRSQIVALIGPNGAGKTTLMRILTGYLAASGGTARVLGFDIGRERLAAAHQIGYLPENGPLYLDMTPHEMLHFFAEARSLPNDQRHERIETVAEQCGLNGILDKPIGKLSKGLRQRVGMAQALLHDPALLIMDEPTAGLDPIQILRFREHVRELRRNKTLLVSTHILQEAEAIADRVLVINNGRLGWDGTPKQLGAEGSFEKLFLQLIREQDSASHTAVRTGEVR